MRTIFPALFCLFIACFSAAAAAADEAWVAARATNQVSYTLDNKTWSPLRKGMVVPNKAWISTGSRGRLQLVRGSESIAFHPNTLASVVTRGSGQSRKTEVNQLVGQLVLEIEKRHKPHTTVQTPFLAAVVKGTQFTVMVGDANAAVAVDRGLVEVTGFKRRERSNLAAGQKAAVTEARMSVEGRTQEPPVTRVLFSLQSIKAGFALRDAPAVNATAKGARAAQAIDAAISNSVKAANAGRGAKSERGTHSSKGTGTKADRGKSSEHSSAQNSGQSGSNGNSGGNGSGHSGANGGGNSGSSGGGNASGKGGGKGSGKSGGK